LLQKSYNAHDTWHHALICPSCHEFSNVSILCFSNFWGTRVERLFYGHSGRHTRRLVSVRSLYKVLRSKHTRKVTLSICLPLVSIPKQLNLSKLDFVSILRTDWAGHISFYFASDQHWAQLAQKKGMSIVWATRIRFLVATVVSVRPHFRVSSGPYSVLRQCPLDIIFVGRVWNRTFTSIKHCVYDCNELCLHALLRLPLHYWSNIGQI